MQQGAIDGVRMPDGPADVRRGPVDLAGLGVVDALHRPRERDRVTPVVPDDPLRLSGRPGRVDDVERVRRGQRDAVRRLHALERVVPLEVPVRVELGFEHRALEDDAALGLEPGLRDRRVEQRLVGDDPPRLDAARCRDDHLRLRVVDPRRELVRREPAEDDRVHGPDPRAGEHGNDRLGDHRHVDDDPVAMPHALRRKCSREAGNRVAQLTVGECGLPVGDGRVVDQRGLIGAATVDMAVDRVEARVHEAAREPAVHRRPRIVQHALPGLEPVDQLGCLGPECLGVLERPAVALVVPAHHHPPTRDGLRCVDRTPSRRVGQRLRKSRRPRLRSSRASGNCRVRNPRERIPDLRRMPGAGLEPARPSEGHPLLRRARLTRSATPA